MQPECPAASKQKSNARPHFRLSTSHLHYLFVTVLYAYFNTAFRCTSASPHVISALEILWLKMFPNFWLIPFLLHIFLNLITSIILCVQHKLRSTSLCNFLQSLVMLSLKPNPLLWYLLTVRYQVLHNSCLATPTHHTDANVTTLKVSLPYPCPSQKGRPHETTRIPWQRVVNSKGKMLFRLGLLCIKVSTQNNYFLESDVKILLNTLRSFYRATSSYGHLGSICDMELVTK
jgi:hypothetical protein